MARQQQTAPETFAPKANVRVIERRILNPAGQPDEKIELRIDQPYVVRWFNGAINGRVHQAVNYLGWVLVKREWLAHEDQISGLVDMGDGLVRRGERGLEVLGMMYRRDFDAIQASKAALRNKKRAPQAVREEMAHAVATEYGTEEPAAMLLGKHRDMSFTGEIRESVTPSGSE